MPTIKLTKRVVDGLKQGEIDKFYWDTDIKGLGLKVTPKGNKTFLVQYRPGGRGTPTRKIRLGRFGEVTVHQARAEAARILGLKAQGHDPAAELQQMRQRDKSDRFSDIAKTFLEKHASQNRTASETKRIIRRYVLPKWQSRSIHGIEKRDIIELIDAIDARGTPVMANRVLATLRKLFNWCLSRDIISSSPCIGIELPNKEKARDRVLTNSELVSIIDAARQFGGEYGKVIQMLFLTAQRRNEVSEMTWDELDLEQSLWTLPGERTKNEKPHFVHLSDQAKAILRDMPTVGAFVFTSNGATPFSGFSKAKKRLDDLSGVTDWRLHDIRRTVTTGMAMLRVPPHVADKIMNHQSGTISGVAAVYQRHEFLDERKAALDNWGNHVQSLVDGVDRDNVINMHKR